MCRYFKLLNLTYEHVFLIGISWWIYCKECYRISYMNVKCVHCLFKSSGKLVRYGVQMIVIIYLISWWSRNKIRRKRCTKGIKKSEEISSMLLNCSSLKHVSIFAFLTWEITLGLRGVVYQADLPSSAGSWPHHKHPATREKSSAQLHFHLTYLTPLPGTTAPTPLTAFSWPAVWFVYLTFCLEISLHLTAIRSPSVTESLHTTAVNCTVKAALIDVIRAWALS